MNRRKVVVSLGIATGLFALGAGAYSHLANGPMAFDAAVWLQGEKADFTSEAPRLRMADSLVRSGILIGKSHSEIASMLGPPTQTDKFKDYDLVYWLGAERSYISIDSEWLVIRFSKSGGVSEADTVTD